MHLLRNFPPIVVSLVVAMGLPAFAQTATTNPVGFVTLTASKKTTSAGEINFLSLPLTRPVAFQGVVGSANGNVLNFQPGTFTNGQFSGAHYVELQSTTGGNFNGVVSDITTATTDALTLSDNYAGAVVPGTTIAIIRPHWTFASAFGIPSAFQGGPNAASADLFTIVDPTAIDPNERVREYFFNSDTGHYVRANGPSAGTVADDAVISLESGIQVARRSSTPVDAVVLGTVKTGTAGLYVAGDSPTDTFNLISNPFPLGSKRLDQAGLYTGDAATGLVGGTAATADLVRILDPQLGLFHDFYFETSSGKWKTGFTDASLYEIPAGASAAIIRRANRPSFTWYAPQPAMSLTDAIPPLALASAVSRRTHVGAGLNGTNFNGDVNLPLTGSVGVESRVGTAHRLVFKFSNPITAATASIAGGSATINGAVQISGQEVTVNINASDLQTVTVRLSNVTDAQSQTLASVDAQMGILFSDVNGSRSVNSTDILLVKAQSSVNAVNLGNFRADTNTSSAINSTDILQTKSRSGLGTLP